MNVLALLGSPRQDGCGAALTKALCTALAQHNATTRTVHLQDLHYSGCTACQACKEHAEACVVRDDLTEILAAAAACDVLILSTPVYFGDVSAQLKGFIDRMYSFLVPDFHDNPVKSRLAPGKKMVFIQTQGHPDENAFNDLFPRCEFFLRWYGFDPLMLLRVCGTENPADDVARPAVQARIAEIVKALTAAHV